MAGKDNLYNELEKLSIPIEVHEGTSDATDKLHNTYKLPSESAEIPKGGDKNVNVLGKRSLINSYHLFSGDSNNIYMDEDLARLREVLTPTITNLLKHREEGANNYDITDFIYCSNYGLVKNNRMITLRRFPYPCFDDIFSSVQTEPDIGRLVTWSTQEQNNLKDIFNISFNLNYKDLESAFEETHLIGDASGESGAMKSIMSVIDPVSGENALRNPNELAYDRHSDANKVWGDVDVIKNMMIRDKGLTFNHDITLTFDYKLESYDGINPKTAMIDMISHILAVTYNNAKFWGGGRYYTGARRSTYGKKIREMTNKEFMNEMSESKITFTGLSSKLVANTDNIIDGVKNVLSNLSKVGFGKLLNFAGRSSVPVMNSLLTGENTGEWHLTIGNPLNPSFVIGNLVIKNTEISIIDDTLGLDDFPNQIRVTCTLAHAMYRDKAGVESMLKSGQGRTYFKPKNDTLRDMISGNTKKNSIANVRDEAIKQTINNVFDFVEEKFT